MASALILKKLKAAQPGTNVTITYEDFSEHTLQVQGVITDNDFESAVEVTSAGEELVIDYDMVKTLKISAAADGAVPVPAPVQIQQPAAETVQKPEPAAPVPELRTETVPQPAVPEKKEIPYYEQKPQHIIDDTDASLKSWYGALSKSQQRLIGKYYDQYKYGERMTDQERIGRAAREAAAAYLAQYDNGVDWAPEAARLCGVMLERGKVYEEKFIDVFTTVGLHAETAYYAFRANSFEDAGVYAAAALALGCDESYVKEMFIILACASVEKDDASAVGYLAGLIPENGRQALRRLASELLEKKGVRVTAEQSLDGMAELLGKLYAGSDIADGAAEIVSSEYEEYDNEDAAGEPDDGTEESAADDEPQKDEVPPETNTRIIGWLSKVIWAGPSGKICVESGEEYSFAAQDIRQKEFRQKLSECYDGLPQDVWVSFIPAGDRATDIVSERSPLKDAEKLADSQRFDEAIELYIKTLGSPDQKKAMTGIVQCGFKRNRGKPSPDGARAVISAYESHRDVFEETSWNCSALAEMYYMVNATADALRLLDKALAQKDIPTKTRALILKQYVRFIRKNREQGGDERYLFTCVQKASDWLELYEENFAETGDFKEDYTRVLFWRCECECELEMLAEAEADYRVLLKSDRGSTERDISQLWSMIRSLRHDQAAAEAKLAGKSTEAPRAEEVSEVPAVSEPEQAELPEAEEEIKPYVDNDGWKALNLTKKSVVDYALETFGKSVPSALAYLRAASALNSEISRVYQMAALAVNDPAERPDYSISGLLGSLENDDYEYSEFTGYCIAAAFLRTSFIAGRGYDYSAQGLRNTISVIQQIPELNAVCDLLENFRTASGKAMDIYADYRTRNVVQLEKDLEGLSQRADELLTQYVLTPPRENVGFARLIETRKYIFARDGWAASMLGYISDQNIEMLEAEKENFRSRYLDGAEQFLDTEISRDAIDSLIDEGWDAAKDRLSLKKSNSSLQGSRRHNLSSNIRDVLQVICRWYDLAEQSAGLSWHTEEGQRAYNRLCPGVLEELEKLADACRTLAAETGSVQECAGAVLLKYTADELHARLDGTWKLGQERYMYTEFLQTGHVMLDKNFLPEIESTFCALPEFNILARIRAHVAEEKADFAARIEQIYGPDRKYNDYGTAARITEYLADMGRSDEIEIPEKASQYLQQSQKQADIRFTGFLENYALDRSYGRIMQSDPFCYTLEDTVRYWYRECKHSNNCGFFSRFLDRANEQIHNSASQYEIMLERQLEALIENNQAGFERNPGYEDAIRTQISQQNFIVAEDYMNRFRAGDFTLDIRRPEALDILEDFWAGYTNNYRKVADSSRTLATMLDLRIHNRDTKNARRLIDCWLKSGRRMEEDRIVQLLNLLGWQGVQAKAVSPAGDNRTEIYSIRQDASAINMVSPSHPIAAFGSRLATREMQVVCLYGTYGFDSLYEKMRALDAYKADKLILVDFALSVADRRALARKLKQKDSGLQNTCLVIDRVTICYIAEHYNENLVNKTLMAIGVPFAYCQPYVADSNSILPPEMFIGRKEELRQIESREDGVNLIYGGRQLGKSALLKKARNDIEGVDGQRAVLVDINRRDSLGAAKALSNELSELKILDGDSITDDWEQLCDNIRRRMRDDDSITFLLIMLDEGDDFIKDCSNCGYQPIVYLENLQQALSGRFKFVIAGLHDVVRFNREAALGKNSVIPHLPSLKVTPFRTQEAEELLTVPLSYLGMSIENKMTTSQILATVNYFPGLIQRYCMKLVESLRAADYAGYDQRVSPPYKITDDHLRRIMADKNFVAEIAQKFFATLELDQDQGDYYQPIALLIGWMYFEESAKAKAGFSAEDVLMYARDMDIGPLKGLDTEKISVLMQELEDLNILRSVSDSTYLLASKNFRDLLGNYEAIFEKLSRYSVTEA